MSLRPSIMCGKYEVKRHLGAGAFGEVHLVFHTQLESYFALKLLRPPPACASVAADVFRAGAQALQTVVHPGICQLRDFGQLENGTLYVVTDFIEGISLREVLCTYGPLQEEIAARVLNEILAALSAAHSHGLLHLDLKPENIMLSPLFPGESRAILLDFSPPFSARESDALPHRTEVWSSCTPAYTAPEVILKTGPIDERADLYAAGIILYELLTGTPPFVSPNPVEVLMGHLRSQFEALQSPCQSLLTKALAKDPRARFQSAIEFNRALASVFSVLDCRDGSSGPDRQPRTGRLPRT